jgi:hypothetical protein
MPIIVFCMASGDGPPGAGLFGASGEGTPTIVLACSC